MKINISKAIKQFFPNPSLEMVYFEAIANSLDAEATIINVIITIQSFDDAKTLEIKIEDNGNGFSNRGFEIFCQLLETDSPDNKGLGRLVYLNYFRKADFDTLSIDKPRTFTLDNKFDNDFKEVTNRNTNGTTLILTKYRLESIKSYDYIRALTLSKSIELHFLPRLFLINKDNKEVTIKIEVKTEIPNPDKNFHSDIQIISSKNLPTLNRRIFKIEQTDLYSDFEILYKVEQDYENSNLIIALNADNRTIPISDIISKDSIPQGYNCIFLIQSDYFKGKVGNSRQKLDVEKNLFNTLKYSIIKEIKLILEEEIPTIIKRNKDQKEFLDRKYPHLEGYFNDNIAGLVDRNKLLEKAQEKFFKDQKETLEATHLSDELYKKSLEISSRVLTEYILYRNLIIQKLKRTNPNHSESEIHEMIVPMRETFNKKENFSNIYRNNAWLLDDKFMSYNTILSDQELKKLIAELEIEEEKEMIDKSTRPDISIIFNGNPENQTVDIVIVELKKRKAGLHENEKAIGQIKRRARRLLEYYPNKIQRMWFYGIVDIDKEFELSLKSDGYTEIFSIGKAYYKTQDIYYTVKEDNKKCPVGITILSFDSFLDDAEKRNETFLNILKESLKKTADTV
jgi:Histidine kinase-, DNA gyrase B-, and HSP90-like ATPase